MINLATFTIVAHRNLISMYDMRKDERGWIDTKYIGKMNHIRDISIEKKKFSLRKGTTTVGIQESQT